MALGPNAEKYMAKVKAQTDKFEKIIDAGIDANYTGNGSIVISLPETPYPEAKEKLRNMYTNESVGWKSVKFNRSSQYNEEYHSVTLSTTAMTGDYWRDR